MSVRLRGHHLICLHLFGGEGYSPAFVENLRRVLREARAHGGTVAEGADDVCAACPTLAEDGRCVHAEDADVEIGRIDALAQELTGLRPGDEFDWRRLREDLPRVLDRWREGACEGCEWWPVCEADLERLRSDA